MKVAIYSQRGNKLKTKMDLDPRVFGVALNDTLVSQYVRVYRSNQRRGTAAVKRRGEVSGGGKKPWRQKGTGKARHGSIRSPLWVGGGKAHGPKPKSWKLSFPKKMKRGVLFMVLSDKVAQKRFFVVDKFVLRDLKTKEWAKILDSLPLAKGRTLVVLGRDERKLFLPARNIAALKVLPLEELNAYQILAVSNLLVSRATVKSLQKSLSGGEE